MTMTCIVGEVNGVKVKSEPLPDDETSCGAFAFALQVESAGWENVHGVDPDE